MTRKFSFLSIFFLVLGALLVVAVVIRVRSYEADEALAQVRGGNASGDSLTETEEAQRRRNAGVEGSGADGGILVASDGSTSPVNLPIATSTVVPDRATQLAKARAREQRYNELLAAGAPPAEAAARVRSEDMQLFGQPEDENAPTTRAPSVTKRIGSPTANVANRPQPSQTPQRPTQQQPQPQQPQPPKQTDRPPDNTEPPDPDSDLTPPQLLALEFLPNQVKDGETTMLAAQVVDDLSGVATVSGVIASPTGGLQGFACQREGDTNRYVAQVRVPQDAAEGIWKVNYLTLADNARNSINLAAAQGMLPPTANFRVTSSNSDSVGPALKAAWIDRQAMRAGERNLLYVQAEDEKSGVQVVSGVLLSPSKNARIGFGCQLNGQGVWECPITPPTCLDCGLWSLEQIQVQDKASNMTNFRADNAIVKQIHVDISADQCDSQPPQLTSLVLDPIMVSNAEANTILARAAVTDDICGVANLSGQAVGPGVGQNAPRLYFSFERQGEQWVARISVPKHAARGVWKIVWIQVLDAGHNLKAYSERDPALAGITFRVN